MSILDIIGVLHQQLVNYHLHLDQLGSHNIDLDGTLVALPQNRRLQHDLVREDIILNHTQILRDWAQQEKNYRV